MVMRVLRSREGIPDYPGYGQVEYSARGFTVYRGDRGNAEMLRWNSSDIARGKMGRDWITSGICFGEIVVQWDFGSIRGEVGVI